MAYCNRKLRVGTYTDVEVIGTEVRIGLVRREVRIGSVFIYYEDFYLTMMDLTKINSVDHNS